jgi:C-terminal processing protease CtpA/Prc
MDKAIKGMLANLDPYTVYFNEQDVVIQSTTPENTRE